MVTSVRVAVFPVGGWGTRFLPATKTIPKEMLPIVDKPLIQYAVEEAVAAGIERFVMITAHGKHTIEDHFDDLPELTNFLEKRHKSELLKDLAACQIESGRMCYVRQPEPLGLGHAIWCARHVVQEPFAVILPDDLIVSPTPVLSQMIQAYNQYGGGQWLSLMEVNPESVERYGVVDPLEFESEKIVKIKSVVEKPKQNKAPSSMAVVGRYILQPEIFDVLSQVQKNHNDEIQLTDGIQSMISRGVNSYGLLFDGKRYDCGHKLEFVEAVVACGLQHPDIGPSLRERLKKLCT